MMMASSSDNPIHETHTLNCPLLTEERHDIDINNRVNPEHVVNIDEGVEEAPSSQAQIYSQNFGAGTRRRRDWLRIRSEPNWSVLLTSSVYYSIELALMLPQAIASATILYLFRHEHPQALLFAWVVGYTAGCFAIFPATYWFFLHRNYGPRLLVCQNPYPCVTLRYRESSGRLEYGRTMGIANSRITMILSNYRDALVFFFAIWFVVGNVLILGGFISVSDAPNLYRLCIAYLTLNWLGCAVILIFVAMIICCLPSLLSVLGTGEVIIPGEEKGASNESINRLTTYEFKVKKDEQRNSEYGEIIALQTEKERIISAEDSVCCLCLARYRGGDKLRELPCSHFFHAECVDTWLKMKATCPLCKYEILEREETPPNARPWYRKIYYKMIDCITR